MLGLMVNDPNVKPEELSRIQCPTLVVAGDKDMIKDQHTRLIAKSIPGAVLSIIPGNHFIANQNPEAFNEVVLRFIILRFSLSSLSPNSRDVFGYGHKSLFTTIDHQGQMQFHRNI